MTVQLKTLADFRRFLAQPGATIQIIRHDWADNDKGSFAAHPGFRVVGEFDGVGLWLDWRSGAGGFRFDGSDVVTVDLKHDGSFGEVIQYRCWIGGE